MGLLQACLYLTFNFLLAALILCGILKGLTDLSLTRDTVGLVIRAAKDKTWLVACRSTAIEHLDEGSYHVSLSCRSCGVTMSQ